MEARITPEVEVVIQAADHIRELLPEEKPARPGFTVTERLDGVTLDALKELMKHVV